ncbi:MAG: hypothetical protein ACPLRR_02375 [Candidatus Saccharicenans sp.]
MAPQTWQKNSIRLLTVFNAILLGMSWVMMVQAYPRLPELIPYWLNLAGQDVLKATKGPFLFIYPAVQTLFLVVFWIVANIWVRKPEPTEEKAPGTGGPVKSERQKDSRDLGERVAAEEKKPSGQAEVRPDSGQAAVPGPALIYPVEKPDVSWKKREISPERRAAFINLKKELVLLLMIFFNLIFIHIERSLIWLAHGLSIGVNKFYFFSLIIIILLLIPYYRFRRSLL